MNRYAEALKVLVTWICIVSPTVYECHHDSLVSPFLRGLALAFYPIKCFLQLTGFNISIRDHNGSKARPCHQIRSHRVRRSVLVGLPVYRAELLAPEVEIDGYSNRSCRTAKELWLPSRDRLNRGNLIRSSHAESSRYARTAMACPQAWQPNNWLMYCGSWSGSHNSVCASSGSQPCVQVSDRSLRLLLVGAAYMKFS